MLHVQPRLSVTMRVVTPLARLARQAGHEQSPMTTVVHRAMSSESPQAMGPQPVDESIATRKAAGSSLTFVDSRHMRSSVAAVERRVERLHDLVERWRRKPDAAIEASDLPIRLRRRVARREMSMPENVRAVSVLHHRRAEVTPPGLETSVALAEAPRMRPELTMPAPAPPAINVEALTSQVIQQLDRRLIAYRERMGRS